MSPRTREKRFGLSEVLAAAENAEPVASVDVVAGSLCERFGARAVSFLLVDLIGQGLVRLTHEVQCGGDAERVALRDSDYETVLRTQRPRRLPADDGGQRVITPVTNRGDAIGVLELTLPDAGEEVLRQVIEAAHALAYIIVTDRRFTDLYEWGQRTTPMSLAAEIQHRLLPSAACCEAAEFTLACALVPVDDIGGDTYDYTLDRDAVHLSVTDAMGHEVDSAILATLLVNALRRARRAGCGLAEQAQQAHQALLDHGRSGFATGQLLRIGLDGGRARIVNAGHPWPMRLRDGVPQEVPLAVDLPFGLFSPTAYTVQDLDLRPGDRLLLYTDGMRERSGGMDLAAILLDSRDLHPREAVRVLTGALMDACHGDPADDATVLCLDWYGARPASRRTTGGADPAAASSP
ncbi:PP2C family protein-serine/threonine phosphatase [Actinoallomurus soli]|uniref:PP2C family protein-serine/threonine phosphatase n=1 Tax=Actinoallomurus soli TaxID=2952535 RepID=UPI00209372B1|nr:PP2C family protein-serine/threonine phosphatase [Actinoallomurus soli]MCO5971961.1 serine/threonine-protein phosphatase [Actinoallomurus soli]